MEKVHCIDCRGVFFVPGDCRSYACPHCGGVYDEDDATAEDKADRYVGSLHDKSGE